MNPTIQDIIQTIQVPVLLVLNIWVIWQLLILFFNMINKD